MGRIISVCVKWTAIFTLGFAYPISAFADDADQKPVKQPEIHNFEIGSYISKPGDRSMADVARKVYGSARYSIALTQFNHSLPISRSDKDGNGQPKWGPDLTIYFPPLSVLIRKYSKGKIPEPNTESWSLPKGADRAKGWSKFGYLRKTPFHMEGEPVYVLEKPAGQPLLYVKAARGFDLDVYAGGKMTSFGSFYYSKTADFQGFCMTAERVWEKEPKPVKSTTRNYVLPAHVSAEMRGQIKELRLLYSMDKGKTWKIFGTIPEKEKAFLFQAPGDGLYWLILQVVYKDGTIDPKDPKTSRPHQVIQVDTPTEEAHQKEEAQDKRVQEIVDFISHYHQNPEPDRVPEFLALMFQEELFHSPVLAYDGSTRAFVAHGLGHMARGQPKLVRLYEESFAKSPIPGKELFLLSLMVCGDQQTASKMKKWQQDPANLDLGYSLPAALKWLANPKRLPRHRQAITFIDLDYLWADFSVTGEYEPLTRILDLLDRPGVFREKIEAALKKPAEERQDLLEILQAWDLLKPGTEKLIEGNLELAMLHNSRGRLKNNVYIAGANFAEKCLGLSVAELNKGFRLQGGASHMLQTALEDDPTLANILRNHYRERLAPTQNLIKKWLRIDQPRAKLDKHERLLQGTWQAVSWKEDDDQYNFKLRKDLLKLVQLTFAEREMRATEAFPMIFSRQKVRTIGMTIFGEYTIDAGKKPRSLTLGLVNPNGGFSLRSIYRMDGDMLRICVSKQGALPDDFAVPPGSGRILISFKKVK